MTKQIDEEVDMEVREDLFKKISTIFLVAFTSIAPTIWLKDTFATNTFLTNTFSTGGKNRIFYNDGYIIRITNGDNILWKK